MEQALTQKQKRAVLAACLAAIVAMDNGIANTVFAYIRESYPTVPQNYLYLFLSIGHMVGIAGAFIVGPLTMRYSKKWLMIIAISFMAFVGTIYVVAGGRCPYWVMILCSGLDGLESSIISCIPAAVVAMNTNTTSQCVKYTAYEQACVMAGSLLFSLVGGQLGSVRWQNAYYLYYISIPIALFLIFWMPNDAEWESATLDNDDPNHRSNKAVRKTARLQKIDWTQLKYIPPVLLLVFLQYFLFYACNFTFKSTMSEYVILQYHLGTSVETGFINSLLTCMGMVTGLIFGRVAKVFRRWIIPVLSLCMMFGFLSMYLFTDSLLGCVLAAILIGFAKGGMMPAVIGQAGRLVPKELTPMFVSLLVGVMNFGMAASNTIITAISSALNGDGLPKLMATVILCIVSIIFAIIVYVVHPGGKYGHHRHHYDHHREHHRNH